MSSIATLNGVQYIIPAYNDTGWAQGAGNLSLYLAAIAANTLQPTGGAFTLTADVDFGANFGVKALFLKTETANPASAGVIRLASADTIKWRNNANGADIALSKDTSDNLLWNGTKAVLSGAIVNADVAPGAAIAYSKLNLSASIVNADIASAAAIAVNKLAALSASLVAVTDASGFLSTTGVTTTPTELNFVHGVTSALQTQLNAKQATLTAGQLTGTATNDNASAGNVGESVKAVQSTSISCAATGVYGNIVSIALTAGDWDVTGVFGFSLNAATLSGESAVVVSQFSGNTTTDHVYGDNLLDVVRPITGNDSGQSIPAWRVSTNGSTTVYAKLMATYSAGTPKMYGSLRARRAR